MWIKTWQQGGGEATSHKFSEMKSKRCSHNQLAKRSARVLPADLCTDHAHYVKIHTSTILRRNKNVAVEGGTVFHYYILVIRKFIDFMSLFRHRVWFSFSVEQFPSAEFGICNILLRTADKNHRRVELSSSVLLQTLRKLKSLQDTKLSVVLVICLLGSFWILTLDSKCHVRSRISLDGLCSLVALTLFD